MSFRLTCATLSCVLAASGAAAQAPTTRELERMNWMEFRELVPTRIDTVLVPLGTLEPHGVTANGADIIAPVAIARAIRVAHQCARSPAIPWHHRLDGRASGAFTIAEEIYRSIAVKAVLLGSRRTSSATSYSSTATANRRRRYSTHSASKSGARPASARSS
jgi:creatinine amidohydrolase